MSFFDDLKRALGNSLRCEVSEAVNGAVKNTINAVGKGKNSSVSFTFSAVAADLGEMTALPEATLDTPFKTAALTMLSLCRYRENPTAAFEMLNYLKGPEPVSTYEKQFIKERLSGKEYVPFSYFDGALPQNGYTPNEPLTVTVYENPYSFDNENRATLWVKSSGADNMRSLKFRKKPSTGQWFLNDIQCLSEIRLPTADDKWA